MVRIALVNFAPDWQEAFALAARQEGIEALDVEDPGGEGVELTIVSAFDSEQFPKKGPWVALVCGLERKQLSEGRKAFAAGAQEVRTQPFSIAAMRNLLCALKDGGLLPSS